MRTEKKLFIYLGNQLMALYCKGINTQVNALTKNTFRDVVIPTLRDRWNLLFTYLPNEETFYINFVRG